MTRTSASASWGAHEVGGHHPKRLRPGWRSAVLLQADANLAQTGDMYAATRAAMQHMLDQQNDSLHCSAGGGTPVVEAPTASESATTPAALACDRQHGADRDVLA